MFHVKHWRKNMVYLDNAATTYPKPDTVIEAMVDAMKQKGANPGRGGYAMALDAARLVYDVRVALAEFISAKKSEEIVFTSNATEAINLVIKGLLVPGDHVIATSMEHNSVIRPLKALEKIGVRLSIVNADENGKINSANIEKAITSNTKLIVVTHASNVCGSILPIREIGLIAKNNNCYFAVDAAQSLGYLPINVREMKIDFLAFPGHKGLYGPQGTGGLYIKNDIVLKPLKEGGTGISSVSEEMPNPSPERYEPGTVNVPGIAGLGAGIAYIKKLGLVEIKNHGDSLTKMLVNGLRSIQGIKVYGHIDDKYVPVVSFNLDNFDATEVAVILDKKYDIAVRAGLHCAPYAHKTLGTIDTGTIRASLGTFSTEKEIEALLDAVRNITESEE